MTYAREDYDALVERRKGEALVAHTQTFAYQVQAEVAAEHLTGTKEWDVFLQYIQASIEAMGKKRDGFMSKLQDPRLTNGDELMAAKIGYHETDAMIRAWNAVIELPADIKRAGENARSILERLDGSEHGPGTA